MKKIIFILCFLAVIFAKPINTEAAVVSPSNDAVGGLSYIMQCFSNKTSIPESIEEIILLSIESHKINLDNNSYDILCRIVEAEATGGTVIQKMNVASCVLARVNSKNWPNTVEGVVFQKKQFSPISDGRYYTVKITDSTVEAVNRTLSEGLTHECIYFCTPTCKSYKSGWHHTLEEIFQDGIHAYFKGE